MAIKAATEGIGVKLVPFLERAEHSDLPAPSKLKLEASSVQNKTRQHLFRCHQPVLINTAISK